MKMHMALISAGLILMTVTVISTTIISTVPTFLSTTVTTQTWGERSARSICDLTFPGTTVLSGSAVVFIRFDVRIRSFSSVSSYETGSVYIDSSQRWVQAFVDVNAVGALNYAFDYRFSEYLGSGAPSGDCKLYAEDYLTPAALWARVNEIAEGQPYLTPVTEEDRLVATSPFYSMNDGLFDAEHDELTATCHVTLPPLINLGLYEAYIFVNFTLPVYDGSSTSGTEIVAQDENNTWFFGRLPSLAIGYVDDEMRVLIPIGSVSQYTDGYCSVYAVSNDTLDGIIAQLNGDLTTTTSTTSQTTTSTTLPGVNVNTIPVQRLSMRGVPSMQNQMVCNVEPLWSLRDSNQLTCGRRCLSDSNCASIFFVPGSNTCFAHMNVYNVGDCTSTRSLYFVAV